MKGAPSQPPGAQPPMMQPPPALSARDQLTLSAIEQALLGVGQMQGLKLDTKEAEEKSKEAEKRFLMEQLASRSPASWRTTVVVGDKGSS